MTDRELLELAADAIGITLITKTLTNWDDSETEEFFQLFDDAKVGTWNPLTDDGDALRLAVKLDLCIGFDKDPIEHVVFIRKFDTPILEEASIFEHIKGDPYAATRRAIVRAAAAIGKELK